MATNKKSSVPARTPLDLRPMNSKFMKKAPPPIRIAGLLCGLFSRVGKREPPSPGKTQHIRLISITVSMFVEKVRWGLDILEASPKSPAYYTEDCHAPALHAFQTAVASKDQGSQSPMIVYPDGRAMWESTAVLTDLFPRDNGIVNLYPPEIKDEIMALEKDLGQRIGASLRCIAYKLLFGDDQYHGVAAKTLCLHSSKVEHVLITKMIPLGMAKSMLKLLNITDDVVATSYQDVREAFSDMSRLLEKNGGNYLMGDKYGFTAADLSLAALSYFAMRAPQVSPLLLPEEELPPAFVELGSELRETKAGQHALKIYSKYRPVDPATGQIAMKTVDQNRMPWLELIGATSLVAAIAIGINSWTK